MDLISHPANQHCYNPSDDGVVRLWTLRYVIQFTAPRVGLGKVTAVPTQGHTELL